MVLIHPHSGTQQLAAAAAQVNQLIFQMEQVVLAVVQDQVARVIK
jgi:hypothetical protein